MLRQRLATSGASRLMQELSNAAGAALHSIQSSEISECSCVMKSCSDLPPRWLCATAAHHTRRSGRTRPLLEPYYFLVFVICLCSPATCHCNSKQFHFITRQNVLTCDYIRFKIKDDRSMATDPLSSWACIRLDRLQTGLRFLHLLDARGLQSKGVLLMRISKTLS